MVKKIVAGLREFDGIIRKKDIKLVGEVLKNSFFPEDVVMGPGDDAGVITVKGIDDYLLLACDGIHPLLVKNEPYAAGKASIMVNANDIYAMGGIPVAVVNVISYTGEEILKEILEGMKKASIKYRIPILGGHIHPGAPENEVSVAILGRADKVISAYNAREGDDIILAVDLQGSQGCKSVNSWDSTSGKSSSLLLKQLAVMNRVAKDELVSAGKDVSMGGIAGTLAMLLESSKKGAIVDLELIPVPDKMELSRWLKSFLSYGFLLTCSKGCTEKIKKLFGDTGIRAEKIGEVNDSKIMTLCCGQESEVLFDFNRDYLACL